MSQFNSATCHIGIWCDTTFTNHKEYISDYCHFNDYGANTFTSIYKKIQYWWSNDQRIKFGNFLKQYIMKLDKTLFDSIAEKAVQSPRLRMHYDLRDSSDEQSQRILNVLLPGSNVPIHRHLNTSEQVICIQGSVVERLYDNDGIETDCIELIAGSDCSALNIPIGIYHSLECLKEQSAIFEFKTHKFDPCTTEMFTSSKIDKNKK